MTDQKSSTPPALKVPWSQALADDLMAMHGIDLNAEVAEVMAEPEAEPEPEGWDGDDTGHILD